MVEQGGAVVIHCAGYRWTVYLEHDVPIGDSTDTFTVLHIQLLPSSVLQFCHTHVGHWNGKRNKDVKKSLLTLGRFMHNVFLQGPWFV